MLRRSLEMTSGTVQSERIMDSPCFVPCRFQDLMGVTRTHSFCGMKGEVVFTECGDLIGCFENSDSLYEWTYCMESQVRMLGPLLPYRPPLGEGGSVPQRELKCLMPIPLAFR